MRLCRILLVLSNSKIVDQTWNSPQQHRKGTRRFILLHGNIFQQTAMQNAFLINQGWKSAIL